jgi:hypothetical protein
MEAAIETTVQKIKCDRTAPLPPPVVAASGANPEGRLGVKPVVEFEDFTVLPLN